MYKEENVEYMCTGLKSKNILLLQNLMCVFTFIAVDDETQKFCMKYKIIEKIQVIMSENCDEKEILASCVNTIEHIATNSKYTTEIMESGILESLVQLIDSTSGELQADIFFCIQGFSNTKENTDLLLSKNILPVMITNLKKKDTARLAAVALSSICLYENAQKKFFELKGLKLLVSLLNSASDEDIIAALKGIIIYQILLTFLALSAFASDKAGVIFLSKEKAGQAANKLLQNVYSDNRVSKLHSSSYIINCDRTLGQKTCCNIVG